MGNPGKVDYESQIHEASLKLYGKAWNLPGKLAIFLDIDEIFLKPSKKCRNHQNSSEVIEIFNAIDRNLFAIESKFLEAAKIR